MSTPTTIDSVSKQASFSTVIEEVAVITIEQRAADFRDHAVLTESAAEWDIDGDGKLDETELALKNLDTSRKGTLSKEEMYKLMQENLQTHRELFRAKKIVKGLVAFICVLAALVAAFLTKATKSENEDTKTGSVIKTQPASKEFTVDSELDSRLRKLRCTTVNSQGVKDSTCVVDEEWNEVDTATGQEIVSNCRRHNSVVIIKVFSDNREKHHNICNSDVSPCFSGSNNQLEGMTIISTGVSVTPNDPGDSHSLYTIQGLLSTVGDPCDSDAECASGTCQGPASELDPKICRCLDDTHCPVYYRCEGTFLGVNLCICNDDNACASDEVCKEPCAIADIPPSCVDPTEVQEMHDDCDRHTKTNPIGSCTLDENGDGYCP